MNIRTDIERTEREKELNKMKLLKLSIPDKCKNCDFLEIISDKKMRCSYMVKDCILK